MKREHQKQLFIGGILTILFCAGGFALTTWGFFKYVDSRDFVAGAQSARGKVVGFETYDAPCSDISEDIHYAMVRYETFDGQDVLFRGPSKDGLVKLKQGDEVSVLYYPSTHRMLGSTRSWDCGSPRRCSGCSEAQLSWFPFSQCGRLGNG